MLKILELKKFLGLVQKIKLFNQKPEIVKRFRAFFTNILVLTILFYFIVHFFEVLRLVFVDRARFYQFLFQ